MSNNWKTTWCVQKIKNIKNSFEGLGLHGLIPGMTKSSW